MHRLSLVSACVLAGFMAIHVGVASGTYVPTEQELKDGCIPYEACPGEMGGKASCATGYESSAKPEMNGWCDSCADNYFRSMGECKKCTMQLGAPWEVMLGLAGFIIVLAATLLWCGIVCIGTISGCFFGIMNLVNRSVQNMWTLERQEQGGFAKFLSVSNTLLTPCKVVSYQMIRNAPRLLVVPQKMIKFCQLSFLVFQTEASWPESFGPLRTFIGLSALNPEEFIQPDCQSDAAGTYANKFLAKLVFPALVCLIPTMVSIVAFLVKLPTGQNALVRYHFQHVQNASVKFSLFVISITYVGIHNSILEPFGCQKRYGAEKVEDYVMKMEPSIRCAADDDEWVQVMPFAVLGFIFFSIGVPVCMGIILLMIYPKRYLRDIISQFGFLFTGYRRECYFYEPLVIIQKFLFGLSAILAVVSKKDMLVYLVVVSLLFFLILVRLFPYKLTRDNLMEGSIGLAIFTLIISGLLFDSPNTTKQSKLALEVMVWIAYCWVFVLFAIVLLWDWQAVWMGKQLTIVCWKSITGYYCRHWGENNRIVPSTVLFKKHVEGVEPTGSVVKDAEVMLKRTSLMLEDVNEHIASMPMGSSRLERFLGGKKNETRKRLRRCKKHLKLMKGLVEELENQAVKKKRRQRESDEESSSEEEDTNDANIHLPSLGEGHSKEADNAIRDDIDFFSSNFMKDIDIYTAQLQSEFSSPEPSRTPSAQDMVQIDPIFDFETGLKW